MTPQSCSCTTSRARTTPGERRAASRCLAIIWLAAELACCSTSHHSPDLHSCSVQQGQHAAQPVWSIRPCKPVSWPASRTHDSQPGLQVAHLLDVDSQQLSYITDNSIHDQHPRLLSACFTPDSQLVLAVFEPYGPAFVEVRARCGTQLRLISPPQASHEMDIAAPTSTQVVCTHDAGFSVWDLTTGQQLGAVGPGPLQAHDSEGDSNMDTNCRTGSSLIATNTTGSRLAFLAARSTAVQLFDAKSWSSLGSFSLPVDKLPARYGLNELELSMHGCLLRQYYPSKALHFCIPEQASGVLREMLYFEPAHTPLCVSADGAFACAYECGQLKIWDTYFWQGVLEYRLDLPEEVVCDLRDVALTWSSCGLRLLVRAVGNTLGRSSDQLLLLQL